MNATLPRALVLPALFLASLTPLLAHPGHDDGHDVTWELGHLAAHPFATAAWALTFVAVGLAVRHGLRRAAAARTHSFRGSQVRRGK
ncbi:MAG: hypothetical protein JNL92_11350 [Opitutaceae bacterium]|nr:hypothetical protein [Opitutaceae bacterium]